MKNMKRFIGVALSAVMALSLFGSVRVSAAEETQPSQPANPVYDSATDSTDWDFVYFGTYPQEEVTGNDLTDEIKNAAYDATTNLAVVNGVTYKRLYKSNVTYKKDGTQNPDELIYVKERISPAFYDWVDKDVAYFKCEPIRWRVLQNDGESLFLLADNVIDCQRYLSSNDQCTWGGPVPGRTYDREPLESEIRGWLNHDFIDAAFTAEESAAILTTKIENADNQFHGTHGGPDTEDQVFLLSVADMINPAYGFPENYMAYSKTRRMVSTDYARAMGTWMGTYNDKYYGSAWWMLRSPGAYPQAISIIYPFGNVYMDGYYVNERYYGVCPALRVDINSTAWAMLDEKETADRNAWLKEFPAEEKPELKTIPYGDITGDDNITTSDAIQVLRYALRIDTSIIDSQMKRWAADVNGDETVDTEDARLILRRALKLIPRFDDVEVNTDPLTDHFTPKAKGKTNFWIAADSIADYHGSKEQYKQPLYGWGELIGDYFTSDVKVNNTAKSSQSTKSFLLHTSGNYATMISEMTAGDYMFISFGHNDERCGMELYDDPFGTTSDVGSYKWYLKNYYIDPALRAGVQPVLVTPVARRYYYNHVFVNPQLHVDYANAMKELVEEYKAQGITLPLIDLHTQFMNLYAGLSEEETGAYHALDLNGNYDNTHLSQKGATQACEWILQGIKDNNLDLAKYIK